MRGERMDGIEVTIMLHTWLVDWLGRAIHWSGPVFHHGLPAGPFPIGF
jgi:hypothetical protein